MRHIIPTKASISRALSLILSLVILFNAFPILASAADPAPYATAATPSTANNQANIYIYLDNNWFCVGVLSFTTSSNWFTSTPTLSTTNVLSLLNSIISADYILNSTEFTLRYANDANFTNNVGYASITNTNITLGSYYFNNTNTANAAKYLRVMTANSGTNNNNPLQFYTVTFDYPTGTDTTLIVPTGAELILPAGYTWTSNNTSHLGGAAVTITDTTTFVGFDGTEPPETHTLTFINGSNTTTTQVTDGESYTLPSLSSDSVWVSGGISYPAGTEITVQGDMTFTATKVSVEKETIALYYNVSFPTGSTGFFGTRFPASPTLESTNNATTVTDTIIEDNTVSIRDVSNRSPVSTGTTHGGGFQIGIYFTGWRTEAGNTISPDTVLLWADLQSYDTNGDGTVTLTGQWTYGAASNANFCIRYDSKTGQSDTSTSRYTPSLFTTYVGGSSNLFLDGTTDAAAYSVDKEIRALYGNWSGELWFATFPSDEYIFKQLENHVSNLTVEGKAVSANDLNTTKYAIRWYMIKKDGSDGWHVDGRLVEKKGQITVSKEFFGDESAVTQAENGFYLLAVNGTQSANGTFTPYTASDASFKQHILVLDNATASALSRTYPNASFQVYDASKSDASTHKYKWLVEGVSLGEQWQITEHLVDVTGYTYYAEHSVYDTDGNVTALAVSGTVARVKGKTFFLDEDPNQGLMTDFRNFYYPQNSIFLKKEDGSTGAPLSGAAFEFWQYNAAGQAIRMTFIYDNTTGQYQFSDTGTITQITPGAAGFTTISTTGFSYSLGDIIIREVKTPSGYDPSPNITIGKKADTVDILDISHTNGTSVDSAQWSHYAKLEDEGTVLIVRNYSTAYTSVTVNKVWADHAKAENVTVILLADGTIATNAFPGLLGVQVLLNADNNWTHTWSDLPVYANGMQVEWSVKEIKIGDETTLSDNISFANWTVVYSPAVKTDTDGNGLPERLEYTITNTVRRTQLFLTKTDLSGNTPLSGAVFTLTQVEWVSGTWQTVANSISYTGQSDDTGLIHFDNLIANAYYLLTETTPPDGYISGRDSIVFILDSSGKIVEATAGKAAATAIADEYYVYTGPYNITVKNILQYNYSISAPEEITFTFTGTVHMLWNPETLQYDTNTTGTWSKRSEIYVSNNSGADVSLTVEATLTFTDIPPALQDVTISVTSPTEGFTPLANTDSTGLTGILQKNATCVFLIAAEGTPVLTDTTLQAPVQVGTLTIKVRRPTL